MHCLRQPVLQHLIDVQSESFSHSFFSGMLGHLMDKARGHIPGSNGKVGRTVMSLPDVQEAILNKHKLLYLMPLEPITGLYSLVHAFGQMHSGTLSSLILQTANGALHVTKSQGLKPPHT